MDPRVSVIIPSFNTAQYISKAIESLLVQTFKEIEIIVIDDASTDNSIELVRQISDDRIRIITSDDGINRGAAHARNRGIKQARGEWIALLDSDDWYAEERLEKLLLFARQHPYLDVIADDIQYISADGETKKNTLLTERNEVPESFLEINLEYLLRDNFRKDYNHLVGIKPIMKRKFLEKHQINYDESIKMAHDYFLYINILLNGGRFAVLPKAYYFYRLSRPGALTTKGLERLEYCVQGTSIYLKKVSGNEGFKELELLKRTLRHFKGELACLELKLLLKKGDFTNALLKIYKEPLSLVKLLVNYPVSLSYRFSSQ